MCRANYFVETFNKVEMLNPIMTQRHGAEKVSSKLGLQWFELVY